MPVNNSDLVNVAVEVSKSRDLQVTLVESARGAAVAGGSALVGGLLGGPIGLAIGGTIGSLYAAYNGTDKYKSVVSVILEMSPQKKEVLADNLRVAFKDVELEDAVALLRLVLNSGALKMLVIKELSEFMKNEMGLNVVL